MKHIITALWEFYSALWDHRNALLHRRAESTARSIRDSPIDSQMTQLYSIADSFSAADRCIFDIPLSQQLTHSTRSKGHWLVLAKKYLETTRSRQSTGQSLITKFLLAPHHAGGISLYSPGLHPVPLSSRLQIQLQFPAWPPP